MGWPEAFASAVVALAAAATFVGIMWAMVKMDEPRPPSAIDRILERHAESTWKSTTREQPK